MKIYIAAPWADRAKMPEIASKLEANGHEISHKWWLMEEDSLTYEDGSEESKEFHRFCAQADVDGVMNADILLLINSQKSEGKAVEQGIAIAMMRMIYAVGKLGEHSKNVFHYLDNYRWVDTVEQAIEEIGGPDA